MLSNKIFELRNLRGWSQVELAKRLSVSKQIVSNWENNNIQPSIDVLVKLSDIFSVSTDYLLCRAKQRIEIEGLTDIQLLHVQEIINDIRNSHSK